MSLLLKALKQAEQGSGKPAAGDDNLDLAPIDTPFSVRREWVQPNENEADAVLPAKRPSARLSLPRLGLVPAAALIAVLVAIGYGIYVYFALSQPEVFAIPGSHPQAARAVQPADAPRPISPPTGASAQLSLAPSSVAPVSSVPSSSHSLNAPLRGTAPASRRTHSVARTRPAISPPPDVPPTLEDTTSPTQLDAAYQAYQTGKLEEARAIYSQVASRDKNPDALLGLAAIAMIQGHPAEGVRLYQQVLDVDPRNSIAQAALLDALGTTDNVAAEAQLKSQIQQAPSAYLYYALGNLYADQKRWSDAEAAYFEAAKREPANGDYAFNLAISLDHLRQPEAALRHYESAIKLATPDSRFQRSLAEARIQQLKAH